MGIPDDSALWNSCGQRANYVRHALHVFGNDNGDLWLWNGDSLLAHAYRNWPIGSKLIFSTREDGNLLVDAMELTQAGWLNILKGARSIKVVGNRFSAPNGGHRQFDGRSAAAD